MKILSLDNALKLLLKWFNLRDIVSALIGRITVTDLLGTIVGILRSRKLSVGRAGIVRMVTIREASIRQWAKHGDPDEAVKAWSRAANDLADFIQALGTVR